MAYRIRRKKSVQDSVRMIAVEQINKSIAEIMDEDLDRHETVHQVRKRCKKVRGLIRLVRPCFDDYSRENAFFRDAARELSSVRDAQTMVECLDGLLDYFQDQADREAFTPLRDALVARRQRLADDEVDVNHALNRFLARMREARERAEQWRLDEGGFSAVADGLAKTYGRGREAMDRAYQDPSVENFHEWRKRVKYHWYHTRLLRRLWPDMLKAHRRAADHLSDLLGDDHDLAVLGQALRDEPDLAADEAARQMLLGLIDRRRADLQREARPWGERLFAEKPRRLVSRFHHYWRTWRKSSAK